MKKESKNQIIDELTEKFKSASSLYLTDYTGMNVQKMESLRMKFRASNSEFKIVKNTLAKLALNKAGMDGSLTPFLEGPTAIAFGFDDAIAPAKTLAEFLKDKENDCLKVKVCLIEKQVFDGARLVDISKMPTKKDQLAQLVGLLNSPLQNLVMLLNSPMQNLVGILESLKQKKAA
jgi:large subunit ribosomal protein L10